MPQICAVENCKRTSCALCHCCDQNVCRPHLNEHQDLLVSQLNPFVDQINALSDRLKVLHVDSITAEPRQKLERWRADCHTKIDSFFEQKCQELNRCLTETLDKQRQEIDRLRSKISELIREQDATRENIDSLTSVMSDLDREMHKIEHSACHVKSRPLLLDDGLVHIEGFILHEFKLSSLSPAFRTIKGTIDSSVPLTSNDRFLLSHLTSNLCLMNIDLTIVKETKWDYGPIRNMCWSSSLDKFIIIGKNGIFFVDEKTLSIDPTRTIEKETWFSCTCSETSLFLSTHVLGSSIVEFSLLPSIELIKEWKSPNTCEHSEWINDMKYNHDTIALLIKNPSKRTFSIELRESKTLNRLWLLRWDISDVEGIAYRCGTFNKNEWLVVDHETGRLLHITKDGKLKSTCSYDSQPYCVNLFGSNILAVSTGTGLNFHRLQL